MNGVLLVVLQAIFFILPGGVANMFPVLCRKLPLPGSFPIHEKLFGKNKTWKGLFSGWIGAILILMLQRYVAGQGYFLDIMLLDYTTISIVGFGFLFGVGALSGDLIESFIKRRIGIPPGGAFFPWDQLDRVVASLLFVSVVFTISWSHILAIILITPLLHILINIVGYAIGLKDVWW